jgi:hypothetical protein
MEYFVYLPDVGIEHVGIEEEGNHLTKELVPYCVNYKEICTIACERDIHVGAPLMSIRHLLYCNLYP